ncbi:T9SS type A sorting domain-containing protein [uncultured Aquimarina sp.]|uniref:T9SS type A sorting domain-containing protein n=1 Tax=uncultured Aquimarina sp. TaxID=575652 RepID=UPI0026344F4A|nr:T9SS type A sorting domain-containing protein [uncultured Aquimarina sp.]
MIGNIPLRMFLPSLLLILPLSVSAQDVVTLLEADGSGNTYQLIEDSYSDISYEVQDKLLASNNKEIDVSHLNTGIYILKTFSSSNSSIYKIIKQ